ncbi:MAG: hypothetical protein J6V90_11525 [Treponema sp.]|nr:hypothetical protein [Treponema sp.]
MKNYAKFLVVLLAGIFVLCFTSVSCSNGSDSSPIAIIPTNPTNPTNGGTDGGGQTGGGTVGGDGTITINSKNLTYIGEGSETIDSKTYVVKKYAELLLEDNPYFYSYYKFYYLDGKLRRLYMFDHGMCSNMDYKYTDFLEHSCGSEARHFICTYYENGKIESRTENYYNGINGTTSNSQIFYPDGNLKLYVSKLSGTINMFYFCYSSRYIKYYYNGGTLYTFADSTTKNNFDTHLASSQETITQEQAEAKLAELLNE